MAVSTGTFFDTAGGLDREDAPVTKEPSSDPYTITKMAAFLDAMARAEKGRDVVSTHPGAIFGPSPVVSNALGTTSFNRVLLSAARGRIERYLKFPVSWVYGEDIARGCILALDKGVSGERYMLDGRPEDVVSIANACNRMGKLAGLDHEVVDVEPSDDPELAKVFGPTLVAIAEKAAKAQAGPTEARGLQDVQAAWLQPDQPRRGLGRHRSTGSWRTASSTSCSRVGMIPAFIVHRPDDHHDGPRPSICGTWLRSAPARSSTPPAGSTARTRPSPRNPARILTPSRDGGLPRRHGGPTKGRDVVSTHPGAIFGPSPVASNALGTTSFNRVLLSAAHGPIERYLKFPVSWVYGEDIARVHSGARQGRLG